MNWRGRPVVSHEVVVNLIAATKTAKGPKVKAKLDRNKYPTKVEVSKEQMQQVNLHFQQSPLKTIAFSDVDENLAIFVLLCHSSTASVCGSFARHSLDFSGLPQASQRTIRLLRDSNVCGWVSPSLRRRPSRASIISGSASSWRACSLYSTARPFMQARVAGWSLPGSSRPNTSNRLRNSQTPYPAC